MPSNSWQDADHGLDPVSRTPSAHVRMTRQNASVIGVLAGFAVLALFPLPFWYGLGVRGWDAGWQVALIAGVASGIALLAVFVVVRVQNALAPRPPAHGGIGPSREELATLHVEDLARIEADPALSHWLPLARRMARFDERALARYESRYRELLAHPGRRIHAQKLLNGDWVGDAEIDYLEHPSRLVTCVHLQPIERDLRTAGIRAFPIDAGRSLWSAANLDLRALRTRHALPECVRERHEADRMHDPGRLFIECTTCQSEIESGGPKRFPPRPAS